MPARMAQLVVELLNSDGLAGLAIAGAWRTLIGLLFGRPTVCSLLVEMDICRLALTHLQRIGSAFEWLVSGTMMRWPRSLPSDQPCARMYGVSRACHAANQAELILSYGPLPNYASASKARHIDQILKQSLLLGCSRSARRGLKLLRTAEQFSCTTWPVTL